MALWQCDVEKRIGTEYWTNVYYCTADTLFAASAAAVRFAEYERQFHKQSTVFVKARARSVIQGDDIYANAPIGNVGMKTDLAVERLPLFNVMRVDFGVGQGRPSRKYYRLPLVEGDIQSGLIDAGLMDACVVAWNALVGDFQANGFTHTDVDGQQIISCVPQSAIGMRQLRRGSKRKLNPVLP